jgi:hypothetical protein
MAFGCLGITSAATAAAISSTAAALRNMGTIPYACAKAPPATDPTTPPIPLAV